MSLVLDNSVAMRWCFGDGSPADLDYAASVAHALRTERAQVPAIWALEVANFIARGERAGLLPAAHAQAFLESLRLMRITTDTETGARAFTDTLRLAHEHNLSAYDAAYLELALRKRLPLATLDANLRKAATHAGGTVFAAPAS